MKKVFTGGVKTLLTLFLCLVFSSIANGQLKPLNITVSSPCFETGYPPSNVLDGDGSTWFRVYMFGACDEIGMELNMHLSRPVKALQINIKAGDAGVRISPLGAMIGPAIPLSYHTTLERTETVYIIKPDGFSSIQFYRPYWGSISVIEIVELDLANINLPYEYDDVGNMVGRTIVLGSVIGSGEMALSVPELDEIEGELSEDPEKLLFGDIIIYPNPTRGELRIETTLQDEFLTEGLLTVHSINGNRIVHQPFHTSYVTISIADQPSGVYVLTLYINGEKHHWTIIKQ